MPPLPQPSFRRADAADSAAIAALTRAAYAHYIPLLGREPQPMTADYDQILATHPVWLLCLADDRGRTAAEAVQYAAYWTPSSNRTRTWHADHRCTPL